MTRQRILPLVFLVGLLGCLGACSAEKDFHCWNPNLGSAHLNALVIKPECYIDREVYVEGYFRVVEEGNDTGIGIVAYWDDLRLGRLDYEQVLLKERMSPESWERITKVNQRGYLRAKVTRGENHFLLNGEVIEAYSITEDGTPKFD